jgi:hypothetical protein
MKKSALDIQRVFKGWRARWRYVEVAKRVIPTIQYWWKHLFRRRKRKRCAIVIQKIYRGYALRIKMKRIKNEIAHTFGSLVEVKKKNSLYRKRSFRRGMVIQCCKEGESPELRFRTFARSRKFSQTISNMTMKKQQAKADISNISLSSASKSKTLTDKDLMRAMVLDAKNKKEFQVMCVHCFYICIIKQYALWYTCRGVNQSQMQKLQHLLREGHRWWS